MAKTPTLPAKAAAPAMQTAKNQRGLRSGADAISPTKELSEGQKWSLLSIEDQIDANRIGFANTKNPTYVWTAIKLINMRHEIIRINFGAGGEKYEFAFPKWCVEYIVTCAKIVDDMHWGSDPRPPANETKNIELDEEFYAQQCIDLLAYSFGFSRKGYNAFEQRRRLRETYHDMKAYNALKEGDNSYSEIMSEMQDRMGLEDERSVRRKLAEFSAVYTEKSIKKPRKRTKPKP